jgi:hypothetical protein
MAAGAPNLSLMLLNFTAKLLNMLAFKTALKHISYEKQNFGLTVISSFNLTQ